MFLGSFYKKLHSSRAHFGKIPIFSRAPFPEILKEPKITGPIQWKDAECYDLFIRGTPLVLTLWPTGLFRVPQAHLVCICDVCNIRHCITPHCNTLQHTATHCNTSSLHLWRLQYQSSMTHPYERHVLFIPWSPIKWGRFLFWELPNEIGGS